MKSAVLLMAAVAVARGSSFMFSKQLLDTMEPLNLLGVRSLLAFAVLMIFFGKRVVKAVKEEPGNLRAGALIGFTYFIVMVLELNGLKHTTTATASFIENSAVVLVPIAEAILLRRAPSGKTMLMLAVVCSSFGFAMQPVAQRTISSETTGLMTAINPLTTATLGALILHEPFGILSIIGAICIIAAIIIHNLIPE